LSLGLSPSHTFPAYIPVYISHISCIPRLAKDPDAKGHFSKKFDSPFGDCVSTRVHSAPLTLFFCFAVQGPSTNVEHWFWTSARLNLWSLKMSQVPQSTVDGHLWGHQFRRRRILPETDQATSSTEQLRSATISYDFTAGFLRFRIVSIVSFRFFQKILSEVLSEDSFRRFFFFVNHFDFSGFSMFLLAKRCWVDTADLHCSGSDKTPGGQTLSGGATYATDSERCI